MKNYFKKGLYYLIFLLLISSNVFSAGDESDSLPLDTLDEVFIDEYKPCSDQNDFDTVEINDVSSFMILSGDASFTEGDEIISSNNARAIVSSFDKDINKLSYYQNAKTGFKSFVINAKVAGPYKGISFIKEFVFDFVVPCSDFIVSLEESPQQMFFVFTESNEVIKSKLAAQEMMAEIKVELARQAALDAFQAKLAADKAAAAASTAAYQDSLLDAEFAALEAQIKAEADAAEMMAEIEAEMARQAALDAFQAKLAADKAAAAASTAAYQAKLAAQEMMAEIQAEMARQAALDAFQAKLADEKAAAAASTAAYQAKLISEAIEREIDEFEALLMEELLEESIGEEIVITVETHKLCKSSLGLSETNIQLFRKALSGEYLFNIGPQGENGTEFSSNRWDNYISCINSLDNN